jgi:hypothetical protein
MDPSVQEYLSSLKSRLQTIRTEPGELVQTCGGVVPAAGGASTTSATSGPLIGAYLVCGVAGVLVLVLVLVLSWRRR